LLQWWGPNEVVLTIDHLDGIEYGFHGVFHGDPSPTAIVQTFEFEGVPGHVKLDTITFDARGKKTFLRTVSSFQSSKIATG
jgi:hypothetical protein